MSTLSPPTVAPPAMGVCLCQMGDDSQSNNARQKQYQRALENKLMDIGDLMNRQHHPCKHIVNELMKTPQTPQTVEDYDRRRLLLTQAENTLGFQCGHETSASDRELQVNRILMQARQQDEDMFKREPPRNGVNFLSHTTFAGDRFLYNREIIEMKSIVYRILCQMPKGGHLHIHFNAALDSTVLLGYAAEAKNMCIKTVRPVDGGFETVPLVDVKSLYVAEVQFQIVDPDVPRHNVFDKGYTRKDFKTAWMDYKVFREMFAENVSRFKEKAPYTNYLDWLRSKLHYHPEEAYHQLQTVSGSWTQFNARTRFMKGLFNYETAFRQYTWDLLKHFVKNNIQYAEIRPNFMKQNNLHKDDGKTQIANDGIMQIIIDTFREFNEEQIRKQKPTVFKLKVIYCFPRSLPNNMVADALEECRVFACHAIFGEYIAGFDLVGEESAGKPLKAFRKEFMDWREHCRNPSAYNKGDKAVDIPLLLHCGETMENGGEVDGNLYDALLLGAKRIGHGVAAPAHPLLVDMALAKDVCFELCPISNEVLGLTARSMGHPMYALLANNVPCTVSSDNETIFQSNLAHDFYQVFIGKKDFSLFGLKQIAEWSIKHASLEEEEKEKLMKIWETKWNDFLQWVVDTRVET